MYFILIKWSMFPSVCVCVSVERYNWASLRVRLGGADSTAWQPAVQLRVTVWYSLEEPGRHSAVA